MSRKRRPARPIVVFDYGGVLSAGHDPVPDINELIGGDAEAVEQVLWAERAAYDLGRLEPQEYWAKVAAAGGIGTLTAQQAAELQDADDRYFLRVDPDSRALLHDLARGGARLLLLSNASRAFGAAVRRADWFEAFTDAVISAEEGIAKPDPEIFRTLLEDVLTRFTGGVARPGSVIFFDDKRDNVEAARDQGIDAHWWPRNGDLHPEGTEHGTVIARRVLTQRGVSLD